MKKNNLIKLISTTLVLFSIILLRCINANAEWEKDTTGWRNNEDNSYSLGWKLINNQWYYFYPDDSNNKKGYMAHDTIINGYYLNNSGNIANETVEIEENNKLLNDINWQKNNNIIFSNDKSTIRNNIIIDLNNDDVMEMILEHGTCSADYEVCVVTFNNGNINVTNIPTFSGGYYGYSQSNETFLVRGGNMDHYFTDGYKIENNQCIKVFSSTDEDLYSIDDNGYRFISGHNYTINNEKISEEEYDNFLKQFSDVEE